MTAIMKRIKNLLTGSAPTPETGEAGHAHKQGGGCCGGCGSEQGHDDDHEDEDEDTTNPKGGCGCG